MSASLLSTEYFTLVKQTEDVSQYNILHPYAHSSLVLSLCTKDPIKSFVTDIATLTISCTNHHMYSKALCLCNNILKLTDEDQKINNYHYLSIGIGDEFLVQCTNLLSNCNLIFDLRTLDQKDMHTIVKSAQPLQTCIIPLHTCTMVKDIGREHVGLSLICRLIPTDVTKTLFSQYLPAWALKSVITMRKIHLPVTETFMNIQTNDQDILPISVTFKNKPMDKACIIKICRSFST